MAISCLPLPDAASHIVTIPLIMMNVEKSPRSYRKSRNSKTYVSRWSMIRRIIEWVRGEFIPAAGPFKLYSRILQKIEVVVTTQDVPGALAWIKRRRSEYLGYLASTRGSEEERKFRNILITHFGRGDSARVLLKKEAPKIRMVLTALTALRSFALPVRMDVTSVTGPYTGTDLSPWKPFVKKFWQLLDRNPGIGKNKDVSFKKFHFSLKAGPSGPALLTALSDLVSLPETLRTQISFVGGDLLHRKMNGIMRELPLLERFNRGSFQLRRGPVRRLVGIPDLEGKTRVIAILDYWSQTALRPLHDFLFRVLKTIPQDRTFSQGRFKDFVASWGDVILFSIDLTAATDRFPVSVITDVLEHKFGTEFSTAWKGIMVDHPFLGPDKVSEFRYSVGNPMGANSSWSSFTLTHHFIMFWCCEELGLAWKSARYVILGDDVLIGDSLLATLYQSKLTLLGVEISKSKSYVSPHMCEFAKRYLFEGDEVTPFPISSVTSNLGDVSLLVASMMGEERKGYRPSSGIPGAVETLSLTIGRSSRVSRWLKSKASVAEITTLFIQGHVEAPDYVLRLSHPVDEESLDFLFAQAGSILKEVCSRLVERSLTREPGSFGPSFMRDYEDLRDFLEAEDASTAFLRDIPVYSVCKEFSRDFADLFMGGIESLSGLDPILASELSDFFSDPLKDEVWLRNARDRKVVGWSRFGETLRKVSGKALRDYGDGIPYSPRVLSSNSPLGTSPMTQIGSIEWVFWGGKRPLPSFNLGSLFGGPPGRW